MLKYSYYNTNTNKYKCIPQIKKHNFWRSTNTNNLLFTKFITAPKEM